MGATTSGIMRVVGWSFFWLWWCLVAFQSSHNLFARAAEEDSNKVLSEGPPGVLVCQDEGDAIECHFRLSKPQDAPLSKAIELSSCAGTSVNNDKGSFDAPFCVSAVVSVHPNTEFQTHQETTDETAATSSADPAEESPETTSTTDSSEESTATTTASSTIDSPGLDDSAEKPVQEEEPVLEVGAATYRKPYSQYGTAVAQVLKRYPHAHFANHDTNEQRKNGHDPRVHHVQMTQANWYLELGLAHFPRNHDDGHSQPRHNVLDWYVYDLELTTNALKLALNVFIPEDLKEDEGGDEDISGSNLGDTASKFSSLPIQAKALIASVYYTLGEANFADPEQQRMHLSLKDYQRSNDLYKNVLVDDKTPHKEQVLDIPDMERRYADACTKLAMSLIQTVDPMDANFLNHLMDPQTEAGAMEGEEYDPRTRLLVYDDVAEGEDGQDQYFHSIQKQTHDILARAQTHFQTSIALFEKLAREELAHGTPADNWWIVDVRLGMAQALHHSATTNVLLASVTPDAIQVALENFQRALKLHVDMILPNVAESSPEYTNSKVTVADIHIGYADAAVQAGNYDLAKTAYQDAMNWHDKYNIAVAPLPAVTEEHELALKDHLQLLKEYRAGLSSSWFGASNNENDNNKKLYPKGNNAHDDVYYYERNDGYEGDMMANIGALYMAKGETDAAISYMEHAAELYKNEADGQAMADLQLNLAMAYYRARRFQDSQKTHLEALNAFQTLYGDGVNPFAQILDRYEEALQQMQQQQGGNQDAYLGNSKQTQTSSNQQQQDPGGKNPKNPTKVIDLDQYRSSIKNATVSSTTVKEEL